MQNNRNAIDHDGACNAINARAELQNTAARKLERIDRRLNCRPVIGNTITDGAIITHMDRPIGQQAASQLRKARTTCRKRGTACLNDRQHICVSGA